MRSEKKMHRLVLAIAALAASLVVVAPATADGPNARTAGSAGLDLLRATAFP
jgi:hypothetical protein